MEPVNVVQGRQEAKMIVYYAKNRVNGKGYVGITVKTLEKRRRAHEYAASNLGNTVFYRAMRKHGKDSFDWSVLEECVDLLTLKLAERKHIIQQQTFIGDHPDKGYNMTLGGEGMNGFIPCEETRQKMRHSHLGKKDSAETKAKKSFYSQNRSEEHVKNLSISLSGKVVSAERRKKISESLSGRTLSDDHKNAISSGLLKLDPKILGIANRRENLSAERLQKLKLNSSKIINMLGADGSVLKTFASIGEAAAFVGVTGSAISHVINGRAKKCQGYVWEAVTKSNKVT